MISDNVDRSYYLEFRDSLGLKLADKGAHLDCDMNSAYIFMIRGIWHWAEPGNSWDGLVFALIPMPYIIPPQFEFDDLRNDSMLDSNRSSYLYIGEFHFL